MTGQNISHYKILEKLGEGGMGVVYKAHDTTLDRTVALKFLPAHLASSEQDKMRFIQEAKAASALNHPNICTIHAIEECDERLFIVMEYIDGQTLRDMPAAAQASPVSLNRKLDIGIQIADGLAAAHEKGIVHRDIKPENIMIRRDGIVLIMDFGLAKLRERSSKSGARLTKEGSTVGTAGYMSPEQVQGQDVDHRSDIFSFGVLLYELFTGELPFKGVHETALMYEIVNVDAQPMSAIKPEIDPNLEAIVLDCLEKDPKERCQSVAEVGRSLRRVKRESSRSRVSRVSSVQHWSQTSGGIQASVSPTRAGKGLIRWGITIISIAVAIISTFLLLKHGERGILPTFRSEIMLSQNVEMLEQGDPLMAISPDGGTLVYVGSDEGKRHMYLRKLNQFQTTMLEGTEGCTMPFFSPDGKWIGFLADKKIKKLLLAGGSIETICDASNLTGFGGATWGSGNSIIFSSCLRDSSRWHLYSVSAQGGIPKELRVPKTEQRGDLVLPEWLPDNKGVIITDAETNTSGNLVLYDPGHDEIRTLMRGVASGHYADGYLFFTRQKVINAIPFDLKSLTISGEEIQCIPDARMASVYTAQYVVAINGLLAYLPSDRSTEITRGNLVWVERNGKVVESHFPPGAYVDINLSPDGKKIALSIQGTTEQEQDVWVCDIARSTNLRLSYSDKWDGAPVWTRDGMKIIYATNRDTMNALVLRNADASGEPVVLDCDAPEYPHSVTPDGQFLAYLHRSAPMNIWICPLNGKGKSYSLHSSPFNEWNPQFSSDGHWISYQSDESGESEIYVTPFPGPTGKVRISTDGGTQPRWSRNGKELFYRNGRKMMVVKVVTTPSFSAGEPTMLFEGDYDTPGGVTQYDVSPDGQRFLMIRGSERKPAQKINLVLNWKEELKDK